MGDILKGWRRKTGLCLLVMAMPLAMAWLRSFNVADTFAVVLGIRRDAFQSFDGTLVWERGNADSSMGVRIVQYSFPIRDDERVDRWSGIRYQQRWNWAGFDFGATTQHESWSPSYSEFWVIPYWSFVLPLTLFAAYLLLITPRAAKPPVSNQSASRVGD